MRSRVSSGLLRISVCSAVKPSSSRPAWTSSAEFMVSKRSAWRRNRPGTVSFAKSSAQGLAPFVFFDAVVMHDRRIEFAIRLLRRVGKLDLREVERDLVHRNDVAVGAAGIVARDQQVAELDLEIFLLLLARLAAGEQCFFDVVSRRAGEEQ